MGGVVRSKIVEVVMSSAQVSTSDIFLVCLSQRRVANCPIVSRNHRYSLQFRVAFHHCTVVGGLLSTTRWHEI